MDKEELRSRIRKVVLTITILVSIPFGWLLIFAVLLSSDNPNRSGREIFISTLFILVPIVLLVISFTVKKLYWLWLSVMLIATILGWGYLAYDNYVTSGETNAILAANKVDFDCSYRFVSNPRGDKDYLSIKNNGEILWISTLGIYSSVRPVGVIQQNGDVVFSPEKYGIAKGVYENTISDCKNAAGQLFSDVYKNIIFTTGR